MSISQFIRYKNTLKIITKTELWVSDRLRYMKLSKIWHTLFRMKSRRECKYWLEVNTGRTLEDGILWSKSQL